MKIEIGKKYVTRGGEVVGPIEEYGSFKHPFFAPYPKCISYTSEGFEFNERGNSPNDLVAEYVPLKFTPPEGTWAESDMMDLTKGGLNEDGQPLNCVAPPEYSLNPDSLEEMEIDIPDDQQYCKDLGKEDFATVLSEFPLALNGVSELIVKGREKYYARSWDKIPDGVFRRTKCGMRHTQKRLSGQERDEESGLLHAVHEAWNALCVLELILLKGKDHGK